MNRMTIADHLAINALRYPDRVAIEEIDGDGVSRAVTYSGALQTVRTMAAALKDVTPGEFGRLVPAMFGNSAEGILAYPGCWDARVGLVQVNTRLADEEIKHIFEDCDAQVVLCDAQNYQRALRICNETHCDVRCTADLSPATNLEPEIGMTSRGDDIAVVVYTSGTTGFPKGVVMSHDFILSCFYRQGWCFGFTPDNVLLTSGPVFHLSFESFSLLALMSGMRNRIMATFDADVAYDELRGRATAAFLVPTMMRSVLERCEASPSGPVTHARWLLSAGASLPYELLQETMAWFPRARILDAYGFSEAGFLTYEVKSKDHLAPQSVGWPLPGCDVAIFDESGRRCRIGEPGNVGGMSPEPFSGYLGRPEDSQAIMREGFALGGDIGVLEEDGRLLILDRKHDMIVSGGENVYSAEVERVILEYDGVTDAAVFGWPDDTWGEIVVAGIVGSRQMDPSELRDHCRMRMAGYKVPKEFVFLESLPRNAMGKVQKAKLRQFQRGTQP